ncbi:HTTM domain-containing protein [Dyadobacter sp. CY261]|uniref:HTTM domain-containing protein n=1 Tax=Dyadobacter sp. CY261 TaxID=2907203 RepID=UPI001F1DCBE3|nr:HTTM domain-containing protein [Dyadobacter sp. CY261]MCF0072953.1 HTTM domain-containing protein [Dyadobacter sp. CY261]
MSIQSLIRKGRVATTGESLAFFRIAFGLLLFVAEVRFITRGWVSDFYIKPQFFFSFYGFEWIRPLPGPYMHAVFYLLAVLALLITFGLFYRFAIVTFFLLFTYVELLDKSVYLNHYYQVSLLALLMCFLPMHAACSLDRRFFSNIQTPPAMWMSWALRAQVGMVYFFGGVAKLRYDWLFEAQPLRIWLSANQDFPVIGPLLTQAWVAFALSWFAMLFDLSAPFLLSWRRTHGSMYMVVVVFHLMTHWLFYIGMFPWMMLITALIFFPETFHRNILRTFLPGASAAQIRDTYVRLPPATNTLLIFSLTIFFLFQLAMPFRSYWYGGNVLWHEQGFRFAWNIMLMEKNASLEYEVKVKRTGQQFTVKPERFLTRIQARQCSFQPDMILQFAHYLHDYYLENGVGDTEVRAVCYASVNGHPSNLLIDPQTDLARVCDGFAPKQWITAWKN